MSNGEYVTKADLLKLKTEIDLLAGEFFSDGTVSSKIADSVLKIVSISLVNTVSGVSYKDNQ